MSTNREIIEKTFPKHAKRICELADFDNGLDGESNYTGKEALACAFVWETSREGHDYWERIYRRAKS